MTLDDIIEASTDKETLNRLNKVTLDNTPESATEKRTLNRFEKEYFESYDHYEIHQEMLQDSIRTLAYKNAIIDNKHLFKGKIVLDVGCGTGILSMFAAKYGAKHVIGVDMSDVIDNAREIVNLNGFGNKITLLKGKLEDVELPYDKVDIIISEWMGYFLLFESMLDTVLYARDKYLVEGGLIFPDKCSIHVAGMEDTNYIQEKTRFWKDVYGFDYSPFIPLIMKDPIVDTVERDVVNTTSDRLIELDLHTVQISDLSFIAHFKVEAKRNDRIDAIVSWFDIEFPCIKGNIPVAFSTGPNSTYTHWKQTIFYLKNTLECESGDSLEGTLSCSPNKRNNRFLDIKIRYNFEAKGGIANVRSTKNENMYLMS
ncbi:uncharacterized protein NDAI_0A05960 [Naumovozyma dairenensis CBS 421]|uniref:type I protein arginine methyltransferase n=1 Tax=Naumovozyma dairenensis (strain ATCC 10597 / BCRC 20456 / CBS 421 / NBRC 0211 / NRRL Y-12639) TaxID=1071378 RepID=G0W4L3_NAUDC|nr:hypothetical protein NDAI_0A05960 [Naumovozyma dairenensis CBS 421]CCD22751.1 hypothetical protein NDAI_0A05960 [Naumovozyma dairenensis CBS 421]